MYGCSDSQQLCINSIALMWSVLSLTHAEAPGLVRPVLRSPAHSLGRSLNDNFLASDLLSVLSVNPRLYLIGWPGLIQPGPCYCSDSLQNRLADMFWSFSDLRTHFLYLYTREPLRFVEFLKFSRHMNAVPLSCVMLSRMWSDENHLDFNTGHQEAATVFI